jgi:hypothetical protein
MFCLFVFVYAWTTWVYYANKELLLLLIIQIPPFSRKWLILTGKCLSLLQIASTKLYCQQIINVLEIKRNQWIKYLIIWVSKFNVCIK